MATITKSIGTSSRDYSTITAWEADLDNTGIYTSGDDAVGECYNDSAFDEGVTINGGGTVGLSSVKLTAPSSQRHDGTAGSGSRIVASASYGKQIICSRASLIVEWLECDGDQISASTSYKSAIYSNNDAIIRNVILHDIYSARESFGLMTEGNSGGAKGTLLNSIIYNILSSGGTQYAAGIYIASGTSQTVICYNNTIFNISKSVNASTATGIISNTINTLKNNIVVGTNGATTNKDFSNSGSNIAYNMSSDGTASGTGSLTNKTAANQFVSTVAGSEDLHLLSTADAVGAGVDLATTSIDINGSDRNALAATVWDIGAHQYASTASIGTSSRDYSTITLWEADLDDTTIYGAGANAVGECYNDATFSESFALNGGSTLGLDSVLLKPASGEGHDGTADTGVKVESYAYGQAKWYNNTSIPSEIRQIDFKRQHNSEQGMISLAYLNSVINRCIVRNVSGSPRRSHIGTGFSGGSVYNSILYGYTMDYGISFASKYGGYTNIINNTILAATNASACVYGRTRNGTPDTSIFKNNLLITQGSAKAYEPVETVPSSFTDNKNNMTNYSSFPSTHFDSSSITGVDSSIQLVSTVSGSEDLHLASTSDAIGAGTDLGSTPDGVQYDIDGQNRDTFVGTTWDIGADQVKTPASIGTSSRDYSTITAWEADLDDTSLYTSGDDAVGECYNDSTFTDGGGINGGGTVGLNSVKLTAAAGNKHDGTAGTGAKFVSQAWYQALGGGDSVPFTLSDLETDYNSQRIGSLGGRGGGSVGTAGGNQYHRLLLYNGNMHQSVFYYDFSSVQITNNIIYNMSGSRGQYVVRTTSSAASYITNNTAYKIEGNSHGYYLRFANTICKNCMAIDVDGNCFAYSSSPVAEYNISSDGTASGTGSKTNQPASRQFVSTLSGSEDLHLIFKSAAIDAGVDLGTTPDGVQYDINGKDRDTENSIWDIGAHEYGDNVVFGLFRV